MGLSRVWIQTVADGLCRADSIVGITTHRTPAIAGKPSRWLLDIVLPTTTGSGAGSSWISGPLHRTLAQTDHPPGNVTADLARLLARLDAADAAGVISISCDRDEGNEAVLRLRFTPFGSPEQPVNDQEHHADRGSPETVI